VKLLDFGVAMSSVTEHAETMIVGKWLYMSPETTQNDHVDHRSDLFSLGVILYLLCCGHMPFAGAEPREIVKKIRAGDYAPLQQIVAVPDRLAHLVARLLAPNPDDRPQRGQEVAAELTEIARQHGIESSAASIAYVLKQLFPAETAGTGAGEPARGTKEMSRVNPEEASSFTGKERVPASVTPHTSSFSSSRGLLAPMDVSETFHQRTQAMAEPPRSEEMPRVQPDAPQPAPPLAPPYVRPATPPSYARPTTPPPYVRPTTPPPYVQPSAPPEPERVPSVRGGSLLLKIVLMLAVVAVGAVSAYLIGTRF
jgi:serine/threonine protein kinase